MADERQTNRCGVGWSVIASHLGLGPVDAIARYPPPQVAAAIEQFDPAVRPRERHGLFRGGLKIGPPPIVGQAQTSGKLSAAAIAQESHRFGRGSVIAA